MFSKNFGSFLKIFESQGDDGESEHFDDRVEKLTLGVA